MTHIVSQVRFISHCQGPHHTARATHLRREALDAYQTESRVVCSTNWRRGSATETDPQPRARHQPHHKHLLVFTTLYITVIHTTHIIHHIIHNTHHITPVTPVIQTASIALLVTAHLHSLLQALIPIVWVLLLITVIDTCQRYLSQWSERVVQT